MHKGYRFDQVRSLPTSFFSKSDCCSAPTLCSCSRSYSAPTSHLAPALLPLLHRLLRDHVEPCSAPRLRRVAPQGPSLLLLPPIFHALYTDLGTTLAQHIDLIKCEPNYVLHFHDGEKVVLSTDRVALRREVERFEGPQGGDGLEGFLTYVHTLLSFHGANTPYSPGQRIRPPRIPLIQPRPLQNIHHLPLLSEAEFLVECREAASAFTVVESGGEVFQDGAVRSPPCASLPRPFFSLSLSNPKATPRTNQELIRCSCDRMRRAFSFGSMYLGSSPFDAPGTYSLLQWTETVEGIWYPRGGFHKVRPPP